MMCNVTKIPRSAHRVHWCVLYGCQNSDYYPVIVSECVYSAVRAETLTIIQVNLTVYKGEYTSFRLVVIDLFRLPVLKIKTPNLCSFSD
jgi:hypothetical protein